MTSTDRAAASATYTVPAMSCQHCVDAITGKVAALDGVEAVDIDLATKLVSVTGGEDAAIRAAIEEAGYEIA